MKSYLLFWVFTLSLVSVLKAQLTMHNFSITDSDGQTHNLYTDYLNQNKTVVLKIFFTTCPPCIAIAPQWQSKYVQWGSGSQNVEFIEASILGSDYNSKVKTYKNTYGLTMIGVGSDGGASSVVMPFTSGDYGPWYGTPTFAVIAPNRKLFYPVNFSDLDATINQAKALPYVNVPDPTDFYLYLRGNSITIPDGHVKLFVKPKSADTPKIEIVKNTFNEYKFTYPSTKVPTMTEPVIVVESVGPDYTSALTALDLVFIQRHILTLDTLNSASKIKAADVTNDGKVTAQDMTIIRKLILKLIDKFPSGVPSYFADPAEFDLISNSGQAVSVDINIIKRGNVN